MGQEIQKQTAVTLTFQRQPEAFLTQVGTYLETMQKVYRTKLPADELDIWAETLKDYSFQEFDQAMKHLVANPPKYELEDGTIQVWRGMQKLPDVVDVMLDFREQAVLDARKREHELRRKEFAILEKRRAEHPEEFIGMHELQKIAQSLEVGVRRPPDAKPVFPDLDLDKNAEKLRLQAEQLKAGKP